MTTPTKGRQVLQHTKALCPECLRVLDAQVVGGTDGIVYLERDCPEHGPLSFPIWPDIEHYQHFQSLSLPHSAPKAQTIRPSERPCPRACGLCQRHQRKATLVEIEVTQRCNLHCPVCFMSAETDASDVPLERLDGFVDAIVEACGTDTGIQLTGGEPTVRDDLAEIVYRLRQRGFWGVEVNTNGLRIAQDLAYLQKLQFSGLTGVYLQFDGLRDSDYQATRGADLLDIKLQAIENCRSLGVQAVLAMTIVAGVNDDELGQVLRFACDNSDVVAGLALQPAFTSGRFDATRDKPLNMGDVIFSLDEQSAGMIKVDDIWPLGVSPAFCDTGTFLVKDETAESGFLPVTRGLSKDDYEHFFNSDSPQGSVFYDIAQRKGLSVDDGISLIIMNYMDAYNFDLTRIQQCSMLVTMPNGALLPFCSYQLTDSCGKRLYDPWLIPGAEHGVDWAQLSADSTE
ncbi:MAG: radical SAM protein [Coriobacteriales bacterium]|jgi:uncharacterized radical SAM superfamily Fe-S cluster-containing enzyme|nr:radical SAM protein [Coriobacteriales bacterium]